MDMRQNGDSILDIHLGSFPNANWAGELYALFQIIRENW